MSAAPASPASAPAIPQAYVLLVAGPSGSGKSRLADRSGLPVLRLDDFYRAADDPGLPRLPGGQVDWDHPDSWHADRALEAVITLCRTGFTTVPDYDIATSSVVGARELRLGGEHIVVAEGIFVSEIVRGCRQAGVLLDAWCVHRPRLVTMVLRLLRDLREHRKSPLFLLRRGILLARREPAIVRRLVAAGCRPIRPRAAARQLRRYLAAQPANNRLPNQSPAE